MYHGNVLCCRMLSLLCLEEASLLPLLLLLEEEKVGGVEKRMEIDGIPGIVGE